MNKELVLSKEYNYIAVFLTLKCALSCSYCINSFGKLKLENSRLTGKQWVAALNRIHSQPDLPVTLQGGEPSEHPDFIFIINNLRPDISLDILTNLQFDIDYFIKEVNPQRLKRQAPYASIRVSFHPEKMDLEDTIERVLRLQDNGYSIGVWGVEHPHYKQVIDEASRRCLSKGIDFRIKEFVGKIEGRLYGTYKYSGACDRKNARKVLCRTTELLIAPDGGVYRCHSDLYAGRASIGHILDDDFSLDDSMRPCVEFGNCNPCDVKVKTNRFQHAGHTSVEVRYE